MLYAEVRVPKPWNPGFFDGGKNPAERADVFRLGLLWTEPMEGVDYQVLGFAAEWGNARYYSGISFESVFLDSLYQQSVRTRSCIAHKLFPLFYVYFSTIGFVSHKISS